MPLVRRYKNLGTDLEGLYKGLVMELQENKELNITNELKGEINSRPFRSVTATRQSIPRTFVGAVREVTITITGEPEDFLVEVHTGAWFSNLAMPGVAGLLIAGPLGGIAGATAGTVSAVKYERELAKRIRELVKENSKKELTLEKVEQF
ncbi:MAG: hypothetical protein Q6362_011965 [Candidatus Wukongarchaeota archaeon]|nr:hypothetical protein [Candidatus Wukongarchaeota archaeon]